MDNLEKTALILLISAVFLPFMAGYVIYYGVI